MRQFLYKISIYILAILLLAYLLELFISRQLNHGFRYHFQADWHDLKHHNADVLIVGNSRVWVQFDPFLIQNKTGLATEILSQEGQSVDLLWLKFKAYLKVNHDPKYLLLQFDPFFLTPRTDLYDFDNFSTCFFWIRNFDMRSLSPKDGYHWYYRYIPLTAIRMPLLKKIISNDTVASPESYRNTKGFKKMNFTWKGNWQRPDYFLCKNISHYADSFYYYCKAHKIELHAVYSPQSFPSYLKTLNKESVIAYHNQLNIKTNSNFVYHDFTKFNLYNDSTLFYNHSHLNTKGVCVFMNQLLNDTSVFRSSVKALRN